MTTSLARESSYFAIAIGINHYQSFQPLNYAQHDAQALYEFWTNEAGFPPEHCLLLTDSSSEVNGQSTYPTREGIQTWLTQWCQQRVAPGDVLWCFFCGYGVCFQGQDYLMPIDGKLADIPGTGIPVSWLYATLQATVGDAALVVFDMNRSAGIQSRGLTGTETLNLARGTGVATLLSCKPGEFSHESPTLRQGFFTSVLLEGLRYYDCTSLDRLDQYLQQRLPQLKHHHHQPVQHPVAVGAAAAIVPVAPEEAGYAELNGRVAAPFDRNQVTQVGSGTATLSSVSLLEQTETQASTAGDPVLPSGIYTSLLNQLVGNPKFSQAPGSTSAAGGDAQEPGEPGNSSSGLDNGSWPPPRAAVATNGAAPTAPTHPSSQPEATPAPQEELEDGVFWRRLLLWGGAIVAFLLLGTLARNAAVFWGQGDKPQPTNSLGTVSPTSPQPAAVPPLVTKQTQPGSPATAVPQSTNPPPLPPRPLTEARKELTANQASRFSDAIRAARRVRPGEALYSQARQDIERWSQVILDLAEGRAASGQYGAAIATANLVPRDAAAYAEAQRQIARWKSPTAGTPTVQLGSPDLLAQAASLIRMDSASSYSDAISLARQIRSGDRQYNQAQQLIGQWSQAILTLARERAAQGNVSQAIAAVRLVPQGTPAYTEAQQSIQTWGRQPQR